MHNADTQIMAREMKNHLGLVSMGPANKISIFGEIKIKYFAKFK
jgi:hypothetical protein